ncbi:MAG: HD family phosphohydrolase [Lentisphaeria bacterium]
MEELTSPSDTPPTILRESLVALSPSTKSKLKDILVNYNSKIFIERQLTNAIRIGVGRSTEDLSRYNTKEFGVILNNGGISTFPVNQFYTPDIVANNIALNIHQKFQLPKESTQELINALSILIRPNLTFDANATTKQKDDRMKSIQPVFSTIQANEIIISKGSILSKRDIHKWLAYRNALKNQKITREFNVYLSFVFQSFIIIATFFIIIRFHYQRVEKQPTLLLMIVSIIATNIILIVVSNYLFNTLNLRFELGWNHPAYITILLPLAFSGILITVLLDYQTAQLSVFLSALLLGLLSNNSYLITFNIIITASIGCMVANNARNRAQLIRACFLATLLDLLFQYGLFGLDYLTNSTMPLTVYYQLAALSFIGFLLLYFLINTFIPVFEFLFGRTTNISLLEYCDLNHPLLQQLQMNAPGTYHHSLMVATIAEQAARTIDANPLLARVCAYFHDIGKTAKSEYFTENNVDSNSKHGDLKPKMSSLVIMNHVKEGVNLALRYKLKKPLLEAIEQHHGKSLVGYFYNQAKIEGQDEGLQVDDFEFRYPGPLPTRKEIVILSIADACEAASRSLNKPTSSNIESLVEKIIGDKFNDGQFAEANLTLTELHKIKNSIVKTLSDMLHTRVAYPKDEREPANDNSIS